MLNPKKLANSTKVELLSLRAKRSNLFPSVEIASSLRFLSMTGGASGIERFEKLAGLPIL